MHAAARVVYNLKPYDHVAPTLNALHWLPVKHRIELKLCLLVHLVINKRAPVYLQNLLTTGRASNRSASNNDLVKQSTRLKLDERAFSVAGHRIWNPLPTHLKAITDTRVKIFLFCSAGTLAHIDIVLGHRSFVDGNTDSVLSAPLYPCMEICFFALYCLTAYVLHTVGWTW